MFTDDGAFLEFARASGSGVASLLPWLSWDSVALRRFEGGGMYLWPSAGEKSGRFAAVDMNLFNRCVMLN